MFLIAWIQIIWLRITKRAISIPKGTYIKIVKQDLNGPIDKTVCFPVYNLQNGSYYCLLNSLRRTMCEFVPTKIYNEEQENEKFYSLPVAYVVVKNKRIIYKKIYDRIQIKLTQEELDEIEATRK